MLGRLSTRRRVFMFGPYADSIPVTSKGHAYILPATIRAAAATISSRDAAPFSSRVV